MAKGRKQKYINKLTSKDVEMLKAFRSIGYLNENHLKNNLSQRDKRIKNFERDGYIEKCSFYDKSVKTFCSSYRLTEKGKQLASTQLNLKNFYKSSSAIHDMALSTRYFSLSEEQKDSWLTENDLREVMQGHIKFLQNEGEILRASEISDKLINRELSPSDGCYCVGGKFVAVEIVTNSYTNSEILAKEVFAEELKMDLEIIKI